MNPKIVPLIAAVCSCFAITYSARAQGSLTPPGAPAPTMKTLAQIEPRTPISSLPYVITNSGSYYVTTNLTATNINTGITIIANQVTIDLGGFTLQGPAVSGVGIYVGGSLTNVVLRNGSVTGWGSHGVDAYNGGYPRNMLFEHLTISGNGGHGLYTEAGSIVRDCLFINNINDGLNSVGGEISGCIARKNGGYGFETSYATLHHCLAEYNGGGGGFSLYSSRALDCNSQFNSGTGFDCFGIGDAIRKCRIASNNGNAIHINSDNGANVIEDCEIENNSLYGIYGPGTGGSFIARNNFSLNVAGGIVISDSNNYIEGNHVVTSVGVHGISITSSGYTNNVVAKNVVVGGGSASNNYSNIGGANDFGPIGSAASATSPWANISH
ncbi:right-handed parallel beta-helix repeat-containing protein [Pedosphaera parvula]|nr:right-handed parallel beta-helix repeat-containing protein [Pedosphaera parvula]